MSKINDYRKTLLTNESWDSYLLQESRLPGPRANLELAFAVAHEGDEQLFLRYAAMDEKSAPVNSKQEFLAFCGVLGLGYLTARGQMNYVSVLQKHASDARWRIREAVALGLQEYGRADMHKLIKEMEAWAEGNLLERRAAVAALCEPALLRDSNLAKSVFNILDQITSSIMMVLDRKSDSFKTLKKALGYSWSVAVVAQPEMGKIHFEKWIEVENTDVKWIVKQNLKKKRLAQMDNTWVNNQLEKMR